MRVPGGLGRVGGWVGVFGRWAGRRTRASGWQPCELAAELRHWVRLVRGRRERPPSQAAVPARALARVGLRLSLGVAACPPLPLHHLHRSATTAAGRTFSWTLLRLARAGWRCRAGQWASVFRRLPPPGWPAGASCSSSAAASRTPRWVGGGRLQLGGWDTQLGGFGSRAAARGAAQTVRRAMLRCLPAPPLPQPRRPQSFNRWLDGKLAEGPVSSLLVYPEGTRSMHQHSLPLKRGEARPATAAACRAGAQAGVGAQAGRAACASWPAAMPDNPAGLFSPPPR